MMGWRTVFFLFIFLLAIYENHGRTEMVTTDYCFGTPASPMMFYGAVISAYSEQGGKLCYFASIDAKSYLSIKINHLDLSNRTATFCPVFTLKSFSASLPTNPKENPFPYFPLYSLSNEKILLSVDCNDYASAIGLSFDTDSLNLRLEMNYTQLPVYNQLGAYNFTVTSYQSGSAYNCAQNFFRCWSDTYKCIPENLVCDNVDNCYDNSDEDHFRCTGKIGQLPLAYFIIVVIFSVLLLLIILANVVIFGRERSLKHKKEETEWIDMNLHRPILSQPVYYDQFSEPSSQQASTVA